ncbi:hypothetical protein [Mesonia aquimarina]|uniref:hypothetical protein n=1 Tax=Mesonia aquimarina TaxID=1504967 RepID=UPI000EF5ED4F|nr:hypothetical protein [Mesonia aquimarina]
MRLFPLILLTFFLFTNCKEDNSEKKTEQFSNEISEDESENPSSTNQHNSPHKKSSDSKTKPVKAISGMFQRVNEDSTPGSCNCDCLSIDFSNPQSLCIDKESGLEIQVNYKKMDNGKVAMYLVEGNGDTEVLKKIPWEKFDKNKPLAKIDFTDTNRFTLDWVGFMLNGEVAVDYAILGKKNLEGDFQKI